jgi:hypothetical protein
MIVIFRFLHDPERIDFRGYTTMTPTITIESQSILKVENIE